MFYIYIYTYIISQSHAPLQKIALSVQSPLPQKKRSRHPAFSRMDCLAWIRQYRWHLRVRRLLVKFLNFKWVFFFGTFNIILINQWLGMQFFISTFSATVKLEDINFFRGAVKVWSNLTNGCCFPFHLGEWWIHQPDWSLLKDSPTKNYSFWTCSWRM